MPYSRPSLGRSLTLLLLGFALLFGSPSWAGSTGVVLIHGKWGLPGKQIDSLASALREADFKVVTPEMPWSGRRLYDEGIDEAMLEIDAAIAKLRKEGADRIFVAGHSLGSAAAIRYAGRTKIDGLIVLAPGHFPEGDKSREATAADVARAKAMTAAGKPAASDEFTDHNTGNRSKTIKMRARVFLDYQDPDGPMNFQNNVASIKPGVPVLWVVGKSESTGLQHLGKLAYDKLPRPLDATFAEVDGDHGATPSKAADIVVAWLKARSDR